MSTYKEKLSILSEMIAFATVNKSIKTQEYNFLISVSEHLGIKKTVFEELLQKKAEKRYLKIKQIELFSFIAFFF